VGGGAAAGAHSLADAPAQLARSLFELTLDADPGHGMLLSGLEQAALNAACRWG
jgi:hypothetical protein